MRASVLFLAMPLVATAAACSGSGPAVPASVAGGRSSESGWTSYPPPVTEPGSRTTLRYEDDGQVLDYTLVLPSAYEPGRELPVLLALPPGVQGQGEVDAVLDAYWESEAQQRGWIVVSPVAPAGGLYFEPESAALLPGLLAAVAGYYPPEGGKFHLAGVSNGGLSAFRLALDHPELFSSVLTVPGNPPEAADYDHLDRLRDIPALLVVGGEDTSWRAQSERTVSELERLGDNASLIVSPGEGHIVRNVPAGQLWDFLDSTRP